MDSEDVLLMLAALLLLGAFIFLIGVGSGQSSLCYSLAEELGTESIMLGKECLLEVDGVFVRLKDLIAP